MQGHTIKKKLFGIIMGLLCIGGCACYIAYSAFGQTDLFSTTLKGWWTLFLIIPGLLGMFTKGTRLFSFGLTLLGAALFCRERDWFGLFEASIKWWELALAILLLLIGLRIIGSALGICKHEHPAAYVTDNAGGFGCATDSTGAKCSSGAAKGGEVNAIFSQQSYNYNGREFTGVELNGIFGTVELDLRNAIIPSDCVIEANGVFGGVIIYAGENANYRIIKNTVFGNVSDQPAAVHDALPTVTITANAIFGNVEVK